MPDMLGHDGFCEAVVSDARFEVFPHVLGGIVEHVSLYGFVPEGDLQDNEPLDHIGEIPLVLAKELMLFKIHGPVDGGVHGER